MTIELSLRRRAVRARFLAILWLCLVAAILTATYISLPALAGKLLASVTTITGASPKTDTTAKDSAQLVAKPAVTPQVFTLTSLALGVFAVSFGCYFLSKTALIELESASRLTGLADALCVAGSDFAKFEKAVALLVPKAGGTYRPEDIFRQRPQAIGRHIKATEIGRCIRQLAVIVHATPHSAEPESKVWLVALASEALNARVQRPSYFRCATTNET